MTTPTSNAVPSNDVADLLFNAEKLDEFINGTGDYYTDRLGVQHLTLVGALRKVGYEVPVAFASGLSIVRSTQTVTNAGLTYQANPANVPFTTTGTFNPAQWVLLTASISTFMAGVMSLTNAAAVRIALGAQEAGSYAASGSNADITSLGALAAVPTVVASAITAAAAANGTPVQGSFKKLALSSTGTNALVAISADELVLESAANAFQTLRNINLTTLSTAAAGANGLDTGAIAANTWYSVWVIWNGTTTAALLSLSDTAPTMPGGYTHRARVGWIRTDGTANRFPLAFRQGGRVVDYAPTAGSNLTALPIMSSGTQGSPTVPTWVSVSTLGFVPPTASSASLLLQISTNTAIAAPNASYGSVTSLTNKAPMVASCSASSNFSISKMMKLETSNVYFASDNAGGALVCAGWEDNL
jgi:hypothetical protein